MKCPNCQAGISDDSRFCSKCGTPIQAAERIVFSQTRTILRPMEEMAPETLLAGKYRIIKVFGRETPTSSSDPVFDASTA